MKKDRYNYMKKDRCNYCQGKELIMRMEYFNVKNIYNHNIRVNPFNANIYY